MAELLPIVMRTSFQWIDVPVLGLDAWREQVNFTSSASPVHSGLLGCWLSGKLISPLSAVHAGGFMLLADPAIN